MIREAAEISRGPIVSRDLACFDTILSVSPTVDAHCFKSKRDGNPHELLGGNN
jgi:hypothetical protein